MSPNERAPLVPSPSRPTSTSRCFRSARTRRPIARSRRTACGSSACWARRWSVVSARSAPRACRGGLHRHQSSAAPGASEAARAILDDPEASDNDKFVAYDFLKNANIAAGGVLPMCQDTGTAIIMGKKGRLIWTDGDDEAALAEGARDAYLKSNLRYSQLAPLSMFEEKNTQAPTCRRRSRSTPRARATRTPPTSSCSSPKAAARPIRRSCSRRRPRS